VVSWSYKLANSLGLVGSNGSTVHPVYLYSIILVDIAEMDRRRSALELCDNITIRYDTIEGLTWTQKLSIQLNLAHVARN